MKKFFTLAMLTLMVAMGVNAQETRKVWDLRKGFSAETIDKLTSSSNWTNNYNAETGIGYFESKASRKVGQIVATVDGEDWVVPETEGLTFGATSNQHLNVVIDHKTLGAHVWLNGKKSEDYMTVPQVPAGSEVTIIYSSHKDTENRGSRVLAYSRMPMASSNGPRRAWTL